MDDKAGLRTAAPRGLTRGQVAELLGIPESEVGRMDGRLLHPVRTGDRRWLYELSELRGLLDRSNGPLRGSPVVTGETAAAVFELFEAGKSLPQVVIATKQAPLAVENLRVAYDRMARSMALPADAVSQLRSLIGIEFRADTLVKAVQVALSRVFREGREDGADFGVVRDPKTGEMRPIPRLPFSNGSAAAAGSAGPRSAAARTVADGDVLPPDPVAAKAPPPQPAAPDRCAHETAADPEG